MKPRRTLGWHMTPERRWSQLHRIDDRLLEMAAAAEALAAVVPVPESEEPEPLPDEPMENPAVLTESDVRRIVHEELAEVLEVIQ